MRQKLIFPLIVTTLLIGLGIYGIFTINSKLFADEISINKPVVGKVNKDSKTSDLKTIIHEAEKSVLQIEGVNEQDKKTGSGFLFNNQGDIITNAHVINDSEIIYVRTANARTYVAAIVGISEEIDVAVIRVPELADQPFLIMDIEVPVDIGDEILALGSPHGFQNSATIGIISGLDRNFSVDGFEYKNTFQISAQITQGNSGGPLINRNTGTVIGINSVGTEDGTIGFSIPVSKVHDKVHEWANNIDNDQLDFNVTATLFNDFDPDELENDSHYLIEYFFDGIQVRDYVNAYALLGSDMQSKSSYSEFRDQYIQTVELSYSDLSTEFIEESQSKTTADVSIERKLLNKEETEIINYNYEFIIGYENDQLKILNITHSN